MKSHVLLVARVLEDTSIRCCVSTTKDLEKILSRVEQEGESFLTLTLPVLSETLEMGLKTGRLWSSNSDLKLYGFSLKKKTVLPQMLFGLWDQVFDRNTGHLLDDPSIDAIQALRQICNLFKKVLNPCAPEREAAAFEKYIECDNQIAVVQKTLVFRRETADFKRIAALLFRDLFYQTDLKIWAGDLIPKHGPGATADRLFANAKYDNRLWTTRLERIFFAGDFLFPSWSHFLEAEESDRPVKWLEPGEELPVRVVSVPKTQKTPRIIAIEPTHMQYVQQAIAENLVNGIERDDILRHLIGFSDQEYSRNLACEASRTTDLATLDLSEASDRVSLRHVQLLFSENRLLMEAVDACRSRTANVPGHGIHTLAKFASMGSALTFPIEAMVFLTICFRGIERELRRQLTSDDIKSFTGRVRVYGDDIIVPAEYALSVESTLRDFGLVVNMSKSFWTGKFRESCGGEYYDGVDVGYVKLRRNLPSQRKHVREIVSAVATRNLFYERGYWRTAAYLDELLGGIIPFPRVGPESPGLGRHSFLGYDAERECPYLQRPLVRAAVVQSKSPDSPISGEGALLKFFLKRSDEPIHDKKHLERAGRPVAVNIKLRYVSSY